MSKIQDRIAEIDRATKRSRTINNVLWVFVFALVGVAGYFAYTSNAAEKRAVALADKNDSLLTIANEAKMHLLASEEVTQKKLDSLIKESVSDLWQQAKNINTLVAYSNYAKEHPNDSIHADDLKAAVNNLLNKSGFVQYQETNGNPLYTSVTNLALEGNFVRFATDKAIRNGAIGINDCGVSPPSRIDVIVQGKTVRVKRLCEAPGSQSIWAEIEYSN